MKQFEKRSTATGMGVTSGSADLIMPPDPAALRRILEEENKQRQDAMRRGLDLRQVAVDTELAMIKRGIVTRDDMETTALDAMKNEHQEKMNLLRAEETMLKNLIAVENERFTKSQGIGGVSDDERRLQALQHAGTLAELQGKMGAAKGKTGLQAQLFDIEELDAAAKEQEDMGQRIQDSLNSNFQIGEDLRHREQDDTLKHFQSLQAFQEAYGTTRENEIRTQYDLVRANLAKELDINFETATKVLDAWRNSDEERVEMLLAGTLKSKEQITAAWQQTMAAQRQVSKQFSDDFFTGFAESMKKYVTSNSMFGLGVDQARRVTQGMEQAFGKFFFDGMEGRVQSFEDVLTGLLDFTKQIMSQIAGQLITASILKGLVGGFGGGADMAPMFLARNGGIASFASGGIAHRPMLRWAGGGANMIAEGSGSEAYIPLPDGKTVPVTMAWKGPYGVSALQTPEAKFIVNMNVVNKHPDAQVETQQRSMGNGMLEIDMLITQKMQNAIASGKLDPAMRARYSTQPALTRR